MVKERPADSRAVKKPLILVAAPSTSACFQSKAVIFAAASNSPFHIIEVVIMRIKILNVKEVSL
jgi:hypothetical protein